MKPASRFAVAAAAAGIVSFTYQRIAEARDRRRSRRPGGWSTSAADACTC